MAETDTTETVTDETSEPAEDEDAGTAPGADELDRMRAALKKANAEAARYRKEAKANAAAAQRLKEAEDADKSEAEKLSERAQTAEGRRTQLEQEILRLKVALSKGLTEKQAQRLVGSTVEELETDADELRETFAGKPVEADAKPADAGDSKDAATPTRRPKERLRPGAAPDAEPGVDPAKLAKSILDSPF